MRQALNRIVQARSSGYSGGQIQEQQMTASPLDDFRALLGNLPPLDLEAQATTENLFNSARIEKSSLRNIVVRLTRIAGRKASVSRPSLALFAGAHGLARLGVSEQRLDATMAAVAAFGSGDAPVNHLCAANMVGLKVYDLALHLPTGDISRLDAMDERTSAATIAFGMEAIAGGPDLVILSSIRSAGADVVAHILLGAIDPAFDATAGLNEKAADAVKLALARGRDLDPLAWLSSHGGREFAAIAGALVAARIEKLPVILDGQPALCVAALLHRVNPEAVAHCFVAEAPDGLTQHAARLLGLPPLLPPNTGAGEGTAGVVAVALVKDALAVNAGLAAHARAAAH
jgi:nicotinate-nucleotide--dimethylbenzimidazole phosphoribosyltransferase